MVSTGPTAVGAAPARRLAADITAEHSLDVGDALFQIDYGFGGQRCSADQDQRFGCTSGEPTSE